MTKRPYMFTAAQQNQHYNNRYKMSVDAVALLYNQEGRLLIVKPCYKAGWSLVGGTGEADESPLAGARREIEEEIGLSLPVEIFTLAGVRYVEPRHGRDAYTQILFSATLSPEQVAAISLQEEELSEYRFVAPDYLSDYADTPRIQSIVAYLEAAKGKDRANVYIENETVALR